MGILDFIRGQGSSLQEFYRETKVAVRDVEYSDRKFFVEALVACAEYGDFVNLMRTEMEDSRK